MASQAKGFLRIPVWVDGDKVTPLVNDDGRVPVTLEASDVSLNVNLETSDITLPIDIKSQTITPDINLKTSSITLPIDIKTQTITVDVNLKASDITLGTTESSPLTDIESRVYGWDLTNWHKNPLMWGYTDRWFETVTHTKVGAGDYYLNIATVSPGYVYVLDLITTINSGTVCTHYHDLWAGVNPVTLQRYTTVGANVVQPTFPIGVVLKEGDMVGANFITCANGDVLVLVVWGYKMKIDE